MNDSNNLEENLKNKINDLKILFEELSKDLIEKMESFEESTELIELLENYNLQILNLSDVVTNEEE
jgi:archaellum component FlaC